jgi:LPXTG-motif cell wall-anchored protein
LEPNRVAQVTFTMTVPDTVPGDKIAWDSFGYEVTPIDPGAGAIRVRSEPLRVGIFTAMLPGSTVVVNKNFTDDSVTLDGKVFTFRMVSDDGTVYTEQTDSYGVALFEFIPAGNYVLSETGTGGFAFDSFHYKGNIVTSNALEIELLGHSGETVTVQAYNAPKPPVTPSDDDDDDDDDDKDEPEDKDDPDDDDDEPSSPTRRRTRPTTTDPDPSDPTPSDPPDDTDPDELPGDTDPDEPPGDTDPDETDELPSDTDDIPDIEPTLETVEPPTPDETAPDPPQLTNPDNSLLYIDDFTYIELDEDGIPLGVWRYDEDEDIWIFDDDIPLGMLPQTGKDDLTPFILLLTLGGLLLLLAGIVKKRRELC